MARAATQNLKDLNGEFKREFNILGQNIVIQNKDEADLAEVALKIVNSKIAEIRDSNPLLGPQQISVLALLEVAGNLVKDRKMIDDYREELDQQCSIVMAEVKKLEC